MTTNQIKKINDLLTTLSSAYQEDAIMRELDFINLYEDAEKFADACCDTYRGELKEAGFTGNAIYKAFRKYGDECHVNSVALLVYEIAKDETESRRNQVKDKLNEIKKSTEEECDEVSLDFVGDYSLEDINYLSDCFSEFADNSISVYYADQFKYYEEHPTESEDALLELYDGESIAKKIKDEGLYNLCCFAGVCGQYNDITGRLYNDEENIKKLLAVRYLLKNEIFDLTDEQIEDIMTEAERYDDDPADILNLIQQFENQNKDE